MTINLCPGCMREIERQPCPHCGYDARVNTQPEHALPYNTILNGKYVVGRVLGQGGFGITYIGYDLALRGRVAIKEYFPQSFVNRSVNVSINISWNSTQQAQDLKNYGMQGVLSEARKMETLSGVGEVVRVRDVFEENSTAYIAMDFIDGETLKARMKREGRALTWGEAQEIFFPVISAMSKVHAAGIIHRDISPDNLMLTPEGKVKILDLGAAKDTTKNGGASTQLVVKPGFSPLEQYGANGSTGSWSDVYAMGATLYYALTGKIPPAAPDRLEEDTLDLDNKALRALPDAVREALKSSLAVRAKERTQTMDELLAGLKGEATAKTPAEKSEAAEPPERTTYETTQEQGTASDTQKRGAKKAIIAAVCALCLIVGVAAGALANKTPKDSEPTEVTTTETAKPTATPKPTAKPKPTATPVPTPPSTPASCFKYEKSGDGITITGLTDFGKLVEITANSIRIPAEIDGVKVTAIGERAFDNCSSLTSINIPDSVTEIGEAAFMGCGSLTSITIPNSLKSIDRAAFHSCESLTSITIPNSVTSIGFYAFYNCKSLSSLTIPNSVTSIGGWAFSYCKSLTSINIPDGVTSIGEGAFISCVSLTSINIPKSATWIGGFAFGDCKSLTSITIPNSVTSIGVSAFNYCKSLTSIKIPDSVTSIGSEAFYDCDSLKTASLPGSLNSEAVKNCFPSDTKLTFRS